MTYQLTGNTMFDQQLAQANNIQSGLIHELLTSLAQNQI